MVDSLLKNNIIQSPVLSQALREVDRKLFTTEKNPYLNRPYSISKKEKMTDILTHSVILQTVEPYLYKTTASILDIGTGHGYLTFTIARILEIANQLQNQKVKGIDIHQ